ncbi:MAG: DUF4321 domain-containing protein [Tepidanaerobacter acetatoxydans]|uniref:DUF4321 domain-containing protein n=1 Tax=Tepidanaerobacter TaxID=499228 RepID=UPI000AB3DFBF|nr:MULTISPECIES: DUF4321 domain-containing protein [Tepidanaerobacter]NLU10013.1 DUF4321 domain-containing protein [Tepidanaerobacter acetatoxydans]
MKRNYHSPAILVIILIVGLLVGGTLGQALGGFAPILNKGMNIGLATTKLDLGIISITFGLDISFNLAAALGLIIAILLYQRM